MALFTDKIRAWLMNDGMNWYLVERHYFLPNGMTLTALIDGQLSNCMDLALYQARSRNPCKPNERLSVRRAMNRQQERTAAMCASNRTHEILEMCNYLERCGCEVTKG